MIDIVFHVEHSFAFDQSKTLDWLQRCCTQLEFNNGAVNYILQDRESHLEMNRTSLNHDYYTDILTFDYRDVTSDPLLADIYINTDMVLENAESFRVSINEEFRRVLVHGLLHLKGYNDETEEEKLSMRNLEDKYLSL